MRRVNDEHGHGFEDENGRRLILCYDKETADHIAALERLRDEVLRLHRNPVELSEAEWDGIVKLAEECE